MDPRWGDTFSTEQTNHCSPTCTLIVCGCNDNACSPEQSYCLIMMMMCSVREKMSCTGILKKERNTSTLPLSWCSYFILWSIRLHFFFFLDGKQQLFYILISIFFVLGMKQTLTAHWCNVLEYVEILWALSDPSPVTGIYLWNPFPSPHTSELTYTLPTNDSQPY